jgi:hypothetical protein
MRLCFCNLEPGQVHLALKPPLLTRPVACFLSRRHPAARSGLPRPSRAACRAGPVRRRPSSRRRAGLRRPALRLLRGQRLLRRGRVQRRRVHVRAGAQPDGRILPGVCLGVCKCVGVSAYVAPRVWCVCVCVCVCGGGGDPRFRLCRTSHSLSSGLPAGSCCGMAGVLQARRLRHLDNLLLLASLCAQVPADCDSGVVDAQLACCESGLVDAAGTCCPSGAALDGDGACCAPPARVDACGVCGGNATSVDVTGACCAAQQDANGVCCEVRGGPATEQHLRFAHAAVALRELCLCLARLTTSWPHSGLPMHASTQAHLPRLPPSNPSPHAERRRGRVWRVRRHGQQLRAEPAAAAGS